MAAIGVAYGPRAQVPFTEQGVFGGPFAAPGTPVAPIMQPLRPKQSGGSGSGTSGYQSFPGVDLYGAELAAATKAYNDSLAQLKTQRMGTLRQYGYTGEVDPSTGHVIHVRVDPNAPFGLYQQQLHANAVEDQQAVNAMNDRGIFGGLAHQAESNLRYGHQAAQQNLGNTLENQLSAYDQQQLQADQALQQAKWQGMLAQIQADIAAGKYNTASVTDSGSSSGGDYTPPLVAPAPAPAPSSSPGARAAASVAAAAQPAWVIQRTPPPELKKAVERYQKAKVERIGL